MNPDPALKTWQFQYFAILKVHLAFSKVIQSSKFDFELKIFRWLLKATSAINASLLFTDLPVMRYLHFTANALTRASLTSIWWKFVNLLWTSIIMNGIFTSEQLEWSGLTFSEVASSLFKPGFPFFPCTR